MNGTTLFDLSGRVAIVTGACGLLGREHCDALAEAGANVVAVDLDHANPEHFAAELQSRRGIPTLGVAADITSENDVAHVASRVRETFGRIDILVNNAAFTVKSGSSTGQAYFAPVESYPLDLWRQALDTSLTGTFICSQAVGRQMVAFGGGVIINISSIYGILGPDQRIYEEATGDWDPAIRFNTPPSYSVAKAGILGLTRYLATYWADKNIRVNALTAGGVYENQSESFVRKYADRVPMGRMASKSEYRGAIVFLASDASSYMTGGNLVIDGGLSAW